MLQKSSMSWVIYGYHWKYCFRGLVVFVHFWYWVTFIRKIVDFATNNDTGHPWKCFLAKKKLSCLPFIHPLMLISSKYTPEQHLKKYERVRRMFLVYKYTTTKRVSRWMFTVLPSLLMVFNSSYDLLIDAAYPWTLKTKKKNKETIFLNIARAHCIFRIIVYIKCSKIFFMSSITCIITKTNT